MITPFLVVPLVTLRTKPVQNTVIEKASEGIWT